MVNRKLMCGLGVLVLAGLVIAGVRSAAGDEHDRVILKFDTMIGDPGPTSVDNVVRGYNGASAPWVILRSARGELKSDGRLKVHVSGLVIPPPIANNANPIAEFRAAVSCEDPSNANNSQLFFSDPFPATTGMNAGNSDIDGQVQLPSTCFAPLVFVTSPATATNANGVWFAVTGFSPERFNAGNDGTDN